MFLVKEQALIPVQIVMVAGDAQNVIMVGYPVMNVPVMERSNVRIVMVVVFIGQDVIFAMEQVNTVKAKDM